MSEEKDTQDETPIGVHIRDLSKLAKAYSVQVFEIQNLWDAILRQRICKLIPRIEPQCEKCPLNHTLIYFGDTGDNETSWSWCRTLQEMQDRIKAGIFKLNDKQQKEISSFLREGMTE